MKTLIISSMFSSLLLATAASAGPVAIINGASQTSESGTTSSITTQLTNLHTDVGNTVTVFDGVPADLSSFAQVWDIRFSNAGAIGSDERTQYVSYLNAGGGMFVMGENSGFMTRNNSIFSLVMQAGGGELTFSLPSQPQTVFAPFDGPNAVSSISFAAPGGVNSNGTGEWITQGANGSGSGVAFSVGDLENAMTGALTLIFDVNFMQTNAGPAEQALTSNLIGFIGEQVDPPVPGEVPAPGALALLGLAVLGLAATRRRRA